MAAHPFSTHPIAPCGKGLGAFGTEDTLGDVARLGWNILNEDVSLPVAVLRGERIVHNLVWMRDFIGRYGVKLAPHGKTTMSPALFQRQLDQGAWGITLATASQTRAAYRHGVRRVLLANQLVGRGNMAIIAALQADADFDFYCCVDSAANADALGAYFAERGQTLKVLLELGVTGGRTGARDAAAEDEVLAAIAHQPALKLAGIELYEGVLKTEAEIRAFLQRAASRLRQLCDSGAIGTGTAILSGAGSAWYDVVASEWSGLSLSRPVDIVLRPGCYLTHDVGIYKASQARIDADNPVAREMNASLLPALQLWAYVQSLPEPGRAIIALGKRDAAFDAGLPQPALQHRPGEAAPRAVPAHWEVSGMMDQHAYLDGLRDGDDIAVGDLIAFEISHPCLTFDKWRQLAIVDEGYTVTELVETFF
ncbi:amino acid deaminase [Jeongeupia naejangsanensis]|uniref:Amino acid deaminase n=1 Tax=Jeongeupia naejangsanensis TaxID=613195 RepID=A0ABS2BPI3_9NEIS|nr:amino acid deaminase [Jeongeupia naejangsanensis]MBM3117335.1 amino acid deaminase [Jeongeupia naejangsanensis]